MNQITKAKERLQEIGLSWRPHDDLVRKQYYEQLAQIEILFESELLLAHQSGREEIFNGCVKLNVGHVKEAERHAFRSPHSDAFMDGFRYARNNLQDQKSKLLQSIEKL